MFTFLARVLRPIVRSDRGVTAAEYGLIVAVIIVAIVGLVSVFALQVADMFGQYEIPE